MKFLAYFIAAFVYASIVASLRYFGIILGGLPTIVIAAFCLWLARLLSRKFSKSKDSADCIPEPSDTPAHSPCVPSVSDPAAVSASTPNHSPEFSSGISFKTLLPWMLFAVSLILCLIASYFAFHFNSEYVQQSQVVSDLRSEVSEYKRNYNAGYKHGKNDGHASGFDSGYDKGYSDGYNKGVSDGYNEFYDDFCEYLNS